MKNYSNGNSTLIGTIDESTRFEKSANYVGDWAEGEMQILGYLKTHSELYNKDQYSLYIHHVSGTGKKKIDEYILMNVPYWYGTKLANDFHKSGQSAEQYFENSYVKNISSFMTKYNTASYNITIY